MFDPIAFHLGPLAVRWYGIAYAVSLLVSIGILVLMNKKRPVFKDNNQIFDFLFWIFLLGVLIGGRLGYVLFYNLPYYLESPVRTFALWEGGMSFHGGMIGSVLVMVFLARKHRLDLFHMTDMLAVPAGLVTFWSRIANFINRELFGRIIEHESWKWIGVDFGDGYLRFPSQLFQSAAAVVLFLTLLFIYRQKPKKGITTACYFIFYGLIRFTLEFWRQPDPQIGFLLKYFTLGQLFSLIMALAGLAGLLWLRGRE